MNDRLMLASSEDRGPVLLEAVSTADPEKARDLVRRWWTVCESWGDQLPEALEMLGRLGYTEDGKPLPDGDFFEIWRATTGEDAEPDGGGWSLRREVAEQFARMLTSVRASWVLGIHADEPVVWRGIVRRDDVLGYFTERDEDEVVVPNGSVWDVTAIAKLVKS